MLNIIIPAYNEEKNMELVEALLVPELKKIKLHWGIIFIDDGSTDKTLERMNVYKKKYKEKVQIISHSENSGLGISLRDGITAARGDIIIPLDADFTFHPRDIHKLLERFSQGDVDVVIGSHFSKEGKTEDIPFYRLYLSKAVNLLYQLLLQQRIASISSIFRLYNAEDVKSLPLTAKGFDINAEILFFLLKKKKKVVEVPVTLTKRRYGLSKLTMRKEIWNHGKLLAKIGFWRLKSICS